MKKTILFLFVILFWGCEDADTNFNLQDGNYSGAFTITDSNGISQSGNVMFSFSNNSYTVIPEKLYLPPVGAGTFSAIGNNIILNDTAIHTAEFDWTLILNGSFEISYNGSVLTLKQNDIKHNRKRFFSLTKLI